MSEEKFGGADEAEANVRARLRELESCEYLLSYIASTLEDNWGRDDDLHKELFKIRTRVYRAKDRAWQSLAMLAPISPTALKTLERRLRFKMGNSNQSLDDFLGRKWTHHATADAELRKHINDRLEEALKIRPADVDVVEVPKRVLSPEL